MKELIKEALNDYFSDFKNYHLIILICFSLLNVSIHIIQSIFISRKIEKFKGELKKSEIKFSRYNELQINALRKIYHDLVSLQSSNNLLFSSNPSIGHEKYKHRINEWIRNYLVCANEFAKEKILLTDELKNFLDRTLKDFEEIKSILLNERESLDNNEIINGGDWSSMYDIEEHELEIISKKIQNIKEKDSIKNSDTHIRQLRVKIESVFNEMI